MPLLPSMQKYARPRSGDNGLALIGVLWLVALLSVFAMATVSLLRTDRFAAQIALEDAKAESLADAGIYLVLHDMCNPLTARNIPVDGGERKLSVAGVEVTVSVQDESGKIDINFASKDLLAALLRVSGLSVGESARIAAQIGDRRADVRQSASQSDLPFHSIEEFRQIAGIAADAFQRIRPALTVYSQKPVVVAAYAPQEVLLALPDTDKTKLHGQLAFRPAKEAKIEGGESGFGGGAGQERFEGRAFTLSARARVGEVLHSRRAVVRITGDIHQPYWVLEWAGE